MKTCAMKILPAIFAILLVALSLSSKAWGNDSYLAHAALQAGEFEIARDLYEELHNDGSTEASFILNDMYRYGAFGTRDFETADRYRTIAAERGHPEAIAEICVDAGNRARKSGDFSGILNICWQGALKDKHHDFYRIYRNEFTFDMAKYYAARALEQSDERGLAVLCYWRLWRDIHNERDDMRARPETLEAWETIRSRLLQVTAEANLGLDVVDGKTDITADPLRKWEPCGFSGQDYLQLLVEFRLDMR